MYGYFHISVAEISKAAHKAATAVTVALAPWPPSSALAAALSSGRSHLHRGTRHCVLHPSRPRNLHPGSLGGELSSALPLPLLCLVHLGARWDYFYSLQLPIS